MALKIEKHNENLLLIYSPQGGIDYFHQHFSEFGDEESIGIKRNIFNFKREDLLNSEYDLESSEITFILGKIENNYYRIYSRILGTQNDILIHKDSTINEDYFFSGNNSFLLEIERLSNQPIIIGGDNSNTIPEDIFINIINSFPTKTELTHYSNARITNVLSEYLEGVTDSQSKYEKYLEKRKKMNIAISSIDGIEKYELEKYTFLKVTLEEMLKKYEPDTEKEWERKILEIILILFPKYIRAYHSLPVTDYYTDPLNPKGREIDIALLDADFHLDIIEIKKPSYQDIVSKKPYSRDNHIPMKNLSSAVMQIEKYIFYLNKWGTNGEKFLSKRYGHDIQIVNPQGMLIMGRCANLTKRQKLDFEIIKRQYSNIVDIITYDDLIRRLDNIIARFGSRK